jgi:hypothetical protein
MNTMHESFQSVGTSEESEDLVFDYFGSYSEAPANGLVLLADAIESVQTFLRTGAPDTPSLVFTPC